MPIHPARKPWWATALAHSAGVIPEFVIAGYDGV
jgi:hypothetical protein